MSILILIQLSFLIGVFGYIWFKTDFVPFYLKLFKRILPFKVYDWLLVDDFFSRPQEDYIYEYIEFLYVKRCFCNSFATVFLLKLFSCTICLGIWLSILASLYVGSLLYVGIIFFISKLVEFSLRFFLKIH